MKFIESHISNKRLIYSLLLFTITGCNIIGIQPVPSHTFESNYIDKSIISDQPCASPCWYGLRVGESSKDDVMKTILNLPFLDANTMKESKVDILI
jgi:hypothetical protein